jgi:large subunit ribosomal protein L23
MTAELKNNFNQEYLMSVLLKPHLSEKSTIVSEKNRQFVFQVIPNATKFEIKSAVEMMFNVEVESVRVCNVKSKVRRFKQLLGYRKGWKKAYVALKLGHDINFIGTK